MYRVTFRMLNYGIRGEQGCRPGGSGPLVKLLVDFYGGRGAQPP